MKHFHVCYQGHDCNRNKAKTQLREVGDRVIFAIGQFKPEQSFNINVTIGV